MNKLFLTSVCIFAVFLTSCGNNSGSSGTNDADGDGITDLVDKCPNSPRGFISDGSTDYDSDGCRDQDEDSDDDGDGNPDTDVDTDGFGDAVDVDDDNNGLIEITTAEKLNNIRYSLDGSLYKEGASDQGSNAGCLDTGSGPACSGYELVRDIILDAPTAPDTRNWVPIAGDFTATLEGNNKTISNLVIVADASTKDAGLFIFLAAGSTVRNLYFATCSVTSGYTGGTSKSANYLGVLSAGNMGTISNVSTTGISVIAGGGNYDYVGSLVGYNGVTGIIENSSITNSSVTGGAGMSNYVGGLVGDNLNIIQDSSITNSSVTGGYDDHDKLGGLVSNNTGTIENSSAVTTVVTGGKGDSDVVGGLVGINFGAIQNSSATGNVDGGKGDSDVVGSLVGGNFSTIQSSFATGKATGGAGDDQVGGLVGVGISLGTVKDSYATGDVDGGTGNDVVGSLVGGNFSTIQNSSATGKATGGAGDDQVGGLAGSVSNNIIKNVYATGKATGGAGDDKVGGLAGSVSNSIIQNVYATGNVAGGTENDVVGGLLGYIDNDEHFYVTIIQNSYSLGNVDGDEGTDEVGVLLGKKGAGTGTITITSNYYNSNSQLNNGNVLNLSDDNVKSKTSTDLKNLTAAITEADFTNGWSAKNWDFGSTSQYPSLKSYQENSNNAQIHGKLLCNQPTDFVQCLTP